RFDRQPPPRPPQSTIPQLTSLLINNAGALGNTGSGNSGFNNDGNDNSGFQNTGTSSDLKRGFRKCGQ
ncbi:hypothetical protein OSI37_01465, partial [Mycobacterium ulcerans]